MPLHVAPRDPMDAFTIDQETRIEAWQLAFSQAATHAEIMELYSAAWDRWNSAARRRVLGDSHRQIALLADAHRARSLAVIRAAAVSAAVGE
jgi:hypothetical protein